MTEKKDNFNFPPIGKGHNHIKKPRFNGYWFYLLLALLIVGFNFYSFQTEPVKTNWLEVKTKMFEKGNVDIQSTHNAEMGQHPRKRRRFWQRADLPNSDG